MGAYAGYAIHAGGLVGIRLGYGYDLAVRRLEPEPRLAANIQVDFVLGMLEDLETFHGLVLDRCGAVGADALDSDLRVGDGCVRLGAADHAVVVGDKVEHVPSVGRLLDREPTHGNHLTEIMFLLYNMIRTPVVGGKSININQQYECLRLGTSP